MLDEAHRQQIRDNGFCVVPDALSPDQLTRVRDALAAAVEASRSRGIPTYLPGLDPNESNIRVNLLPGHDQVFVDLLKDPQAIETVKAVIGANILVSNFTANIALPGSGSMNVHSDQALVVPEPWDSPWAINIIWCLDDVYADNGATLYLPGSHKFRKFADVPDAPESQMKPFEAPAGSFVAMEGRLWHTSGANITADQQRRMLFAYYAMDFIRPQINWEAALSKNIKSSLDAEERTLLGLSAMGNTRIGGGLTKLQRT